MGWGLIIKQVCFNKVHRSELPDIVEDADYSIGQARDKLLLMAASTPRPVETEEGRIDWNDHVHAEVADILDGLEEDIIRRYLAKLCINNPDDVTED